ncbi:MAG TPA: hypothetical protein VHX64_03395 [Caulobacteraceae bacterium]|nr:hypothetical protein [Caulobacteraceae bacterium]
MNKPQPGIWLVLTFAAVALTLTPAGAPARAQTAQPDYHPSLADLMTLAVQPRHIKLALAGRARNWPYLTYEASELRNAFGRVARTVPSYRNQDMATMVAANMKDPLDRLDEAIKARDGKRFDAAYVDVTHACNACHQGLGHPEVVIQVPQGWMYPDQNFGSVRARR